MHIREVVLYPDFSIDLEKMMGKKFHIRKEKTKQLVLLKSAVAKQTPVNSLRRFYVSLPLPELHTGHPVPCGGLEPLFHPAVLKKIDELLKAGIYDARHVRVIVHDFVKETLLNQLPGPCPYNVVLFPTESSLADYIYMWSITVNSTVIIESGHQFTEKASKEDVEGSINELMNLVQNCQNEQVLAEAKYEMTKLIDSVTNKSVAETSRSKPPKKRRNATDRLTATSKSKRRKVLSQGSEQELSLEITVETSNSTNIPPAADHLQTKSLDNEELLDLLPDTVMPSSNNTEFDILQNLHVPEVT